MNISVLSVVLYLILGPIAGGLLAGIDRKITARMQGRKGPSVLQPFYDLFKLFNKQAVLVNNVQDFLVCGFLVFIVFTGCLFFSGGDLLLVFFALTLAGIFFMMSACSANSPFSSMGAQRELMQMMAYEPMVLLVGIGFYEVTGSFSVKDIITFSNVPSIVYTPGIFIGFCGFLPLSSANLRLTSAQPTMHTRKWSRALPRSCRAISWRLWNCHTGMRMFSCSGLSACLS